MIRTLILFFVAVVVSGSTALAIDTDGDGLLDVVDVPRFGQRQQDYRLLGIQDLDGTSLLAGERWLNFSRNSIASIEHGDFAGHAQLESLNLIGNQITSIERGDFVGIGRLDSLSLDSNQITTIESGAFEGILFFEDLDISHNQLTSLDRGMFDGVSGIEDLRLGNNQIMSIESGTFAELRLFELDLENNQITVIESGTLDGLNELEELSLENNQITSIESDAFSGLNKLEELNLRSNQITSIANGAFAGLDELETLALDDNRITSVERGDFTGLSNLNRITLMHNRIMTLESGAFAGFEGDELNLDHNRIRSITNDTFSGIDRLGSLSLDFNRIASIESGAFDGFEQLEKLSLRSNPISTFEDETFAQTNLSSLSLDYMSVLNLTGAQFEDLNPCSEGDGFCASADTLILDGARLSRRSLEIMTSELFSMNSVSIVGLEFWNGTYLENSSAIVNLLGKPELRHVTVDRSLYLFFQEEFDSFDVTEGKTVEVVVRGLAKRHDCDFNADSVCDASDLDMLMNSGAIDQGVRVDQSGNDVFDFDGGGVIDRIDVLTWLSVAADKNGFAQPYELGDANLDGRVDEMDLNAIGIAWLTEGNAWTSGDFDGDGHVGPADLNAVAFAWGSSIASNEVREIPEPCFGLLHLLAIVVFAINLQRSALWIPRWE